MEEKIKTEPETSFNKGLKYWLRWLAVLPGVLIASFLATFPLHWMLYLAFAHEGTILGFIELPPGANISIEYALTPFVIAITFILVGYEIAPNYKFKTSLALTILWLILFVGVFIFMSDQQPQLQVRGIGSLLGSLIGLYIVRKRTYQQVKK